MPVTTPALLIVPTDGLLLDQVPPKTVSPRLVVWPTHTEGVPITGATGLTTRAAIAVQPVVPSVYNMITVPVATPVTIPEDEPIYATALSLLLHTPPATLLVSVAVRPTQTADGPPITAGAGVTVTA